MVQFRKLIFFIMLSISFSLSAKACNSILIDWSDYDKTLESIKNSYRNEDYLSVDKTLNCLMNDKNKFTNGKSGAIATYWFYRNEMHAPGANELDEIRIKKWQKAIPNSFFANFAELRLMYANAWNARGAKYANETTKEQFNNFNNKLLKTEKAILADKNKLKETPISYNLLMAVSLDTNGTQTSASDVFMTGVKKWPNYYDFYEVLLTRLVPKWGGSWKKVDEFINFWSDKLSSSEANSIYARFYYNVHSHNRIDPRITLANWTKLKSSLKSLIEKYPVKEHYAISASYACIYGDYKYFKMLTSKYNIVTSRLWIRGSSKEKCDMYFSNWSNK